LLRQIPWSLVGESRLRQIVEQLRLFEVTYADTEFSDAFNEELRRLGIERSVSLEGAYQLNTEGYRISNQLNVDPAYSSPRL
jgi:hypothetical protein